MKVFVIHDSGKISAVSPECVIEGQKPSGPKRASQRGDGRWPMSRSGRDLEPAAGSYSRSQFTDRKSAVARIWKAVQTLEPAVAAQAPRRPGRRFGRAGRPRARRRAEGQQDRKGAGATSP